MRHALEYKYSHNIWYLYSRVIYESFRRPVAVQHTSEASKKRSETLSQPVRRPASQSHSNYTMDPLSPAITFFDKEGKGRTSYIGSLVPENIFYPTPGLWFTNQGSEVRLSLSFTSHVELRRSQLLERLISEYEKNPYPTKDEISALAQELSAPDHHKVE